MNNPLLHTELHPELPPFETRISQKARHAQIRILPPGRVEVVLPRGMPAAAAKALVATKQHWVRQKLAHFAQLAATHAPGGDAPTRPEHIELAAIGRRVPVHYRATGAAGVRAMLRHDALTLSGAVGEAPKLHQAMRRWLIATARTELPPLLQLLSEQHGLPFKQVAVRLQKSRWGSCSAKRHIALNAKLLCLPAELARHVMLHELAHLKHLNHSRAFWALLHRLDPDTERHHASLRTAWLHLPAWLEASAADSVP